MRDYIAANLAHEKSCPWAIYASIKGGLHISIDVPEEGKDCGCKRADILKAWDAREEALKELVRLKDIKDIEGKTPEYMFRQPRAWKAARRALEGE